MGVSPEDSVYSFCCVFTACQSWKEFSSLTISQVKRLGSLSGSAPTRDDTAGQEQSWAKLRAWILTFSCLFAILLSRNDLPYNFSFLFLDGFEIKNFEILKFDIAKVKQTVVENIQKAEIHRKLNSILVT